MWGFVVCKNTEIGQKNGFARSLENININRDNGLPR